MEEKLAFAPDAQPRADTAERESPPSCEGSAAAPDESAALLDVNEAAYERELDELADATATSDVIADANSSHYYVYSSNVQHGAARDTSRSSLVVRLVCLVLAAVAVIVLGAHAATLAKSSPPVTELLLSQLFGAPVAHVALPVGTPREQSDSASSNEAAVSETENGGSTAAEADDAHTDGGESLLPVVDVDLSAAADAPFELVNETGYSVDCEELLASSTTVGAAQIRQSYGDTAPCVLILHTHGTEAYSAQDAATYSSDDTFRSLDPERGVVSVGRVIAKTLESHGISCIHIEEMFDAEDYNAAYAAAAEAIVRTVSENPSVTYILDVHRDAVTSSDGTSAQLRARSSGTVSPDGVHAAQIMLVVGTDAAGSSHTRWRENLAFALRVQKSALGFDPSLMRRISLRAPSFNQQYAPCSVIVEVGTAVNSVEEAQLGAVVFAEALWRTISGAP